MRRTWTGESEVIVTFDGEIEDANTQALAYAAAARASGGHDDVIVGARSVMLVFPKNGVPRVPVVEPARAPEGGRLHEIDVTYGGEDLDDVAELTGLSAGDVVRAHASAEYRVAFIGFSPGFPYLLGLPRRLHVPRLSTPRARVPAGSVAIADRYSGIYPDATPGGWRLIGRTGMKLFDAGAGASVQPGDRVHFVPR
ncbi:MAG: allophanate hydrolase subunit 1 [Actinomycetota bacterium]|nr:allophanate hydrolase subunit 1 [Actinomycetota bacterium]